MRGSQKETLLEERVELQDTAKPQLIEVAQSSLTAFAAIAGAAEAELDGGHRINVGSRNTFTESKAAHFVSRYNQARLATLNALTRQPAIARVKARKDDGSLITLFITRTSPPSIKLTDAMMASYGAPVGAAAERHAGEDFEYSTQKGTVRLEIIEVAKLFPVRDGKGWDSKNSIVESESYKTVTITSLREFLEDVAPPDELDVLEAMLTEDRKKGLIIEGVKRNVISKMGLRDQPILDRVQGEIFRLPLDKRLLLLGAPGTGKTTTLIRRLGQKLETENLDEREKEIVAALGQQAGTHKQSWLMFTPTDLLKQYIKEAFNREQIPAPDDRIVTWTDYRRELARSRLGILQTATARGRFVLKDPADFLAADAIENQIEWFEDFSRWQADYYWNEASDSARDLAAGGGRNLSAVARQLEAIYRSRGGTSVAETFIAIVGAASGIRTVIDDIKKAADGQIRKALNTTVTRDRAFLDSFGAFLKTLADDPDEADDQDTEDEEEQRSTRVGREAAVNAYMQAVRSACRSLATGRTPSATSRTGRIVQWLGDRMLSKDECLEIGRNVRMQETLRRHLNPIQRYVNDIPLRYGQFRRVRQAEGRWYRSETNFGRNIGPFELDAVLLAMLRTTGTILRDRRAMGEIDSPTFATLRRIKDLYKNQIMVDEVSDFSPLQLACMGALTEPRVNSFFACGDFNQRITEFGLKSQAELAPFFPDIDIRTVEITYRHTRQLSEFAKAIVAATSRSGTTFALPENVNSEGFKPVIGRNLADAAATAEWLARRIFEIEKTSEVLPSIAVLLNSEEAVQPFAEQLSKTLEPQNLRAVACPEGRVIGQENDVRVFDVQHIKGLEFEAVFFVGVDELAVQRPMLFDKYLYVGATRAATYLGLTCSGRSMPGIIEDMADQFGDSWQA